MLRAAFAAVSFSVWERSSASAARPVRRKPWLARMRSNSVAEVEVGEVGSFAEGGRVSSMVVVVGERGRVRW